MTTETVVRASSLACSVWGGMYFPILANSEPELDLTSDRLALDFWYPLDQDPETVALCEIPGWRWGGLRPSGPFDREREGLAWGLLSADLQFAGMPRSLPIWEDDDPLAALYAVWFGSYLPGEQGDGLREAYGAGAAAVTIRRNGELPDLADFVSPATATAYGLTYTGEGLGAVVVIVGDDPADLARVWNARAMGEVVFAWPVAHAGRFEPALRSWLASAAVQTGAHTFRSGDGKHAGRLVWVIPGAHHDQADVQRVVRLVEAPGWSAQVGSLYPGWGWRGHHPVQTGLDESFTARVDRDDWEVTVPVPQLGVPRTHRGSRWPGVVIADVLFFSETQLPPGRSASVPAIRRLATLLGRSADIAPVHRPTGPGRAVAVQASDKSVSLGLVPTFALIQELFDVPGWRLEQSDEGRFGTHLIERLGGPGAQTASQPAVRTVLHHASNDVRAHPLARFIQEAERSRGAWPDLLSARRPRDYATQVVYWLIERGLLRPALPVRCPHCATETDMHPEDIASDLRCPLCEESFALGSALATSRRAGNPWAYRLAANVPPDRIRSALPVMATLAVLFSRPAVTSPMPHVLGLKIHGPEWDCELDIAAVVIQDLATVIVVGEVKGRQDPIDTNDIENLERVRDCLREKGIDTIIVCATVTASLSPEEQALLRAFCDRAPNRLNRRGEISLALPLVLVERDLSLPWMSEDHPWRWGSPGGLLLAGVAEESCRRNLGLVSVEPQPTPTGWAFKPRWADTESNGNRTDRTAGGA